MRLVDELLGIARVVKRRRECRELLESPRREAALRILRNNTVPAELIVDAGTTNGVEQQFLSELVRESASFSGPIVEIGTLFGFTTTVLALAKEPERPMITVDSFSWNPWGLAPTQHRQLTERVLRVP